MNNRQVHKVSKEEQNRNSLDVNKNSASILAREELDKLVGGITSLSSFSNTMTRLVTLVKHLFVRDTLHSKRLECLEQEIKNLKAQLKIE